MNRSDFGRTVAALLCTLVMSATCVLGALAPAQASADKPVAAAHEVA